MKSTTKYLALTKAVNDFCQRHDVTRDYFADLLGFKGDNASIQFSNALNPNKDDKTFNQTKEALLFDAFDEEALRTYFDARMKPYGFETKSLHARETHNVSFHVVIDDAALESDEAFHTSKMALRDHTLDEKELKAMIKEHDEAAKKHREACEMAEGRLRVLMDGAGGVS